MTLTGQTDTFSEPVLETTSVPHVEVRIRKYIYIVPGVIYLSGPST